MSIAALRRMKRWLSGDCLFGWLMVAPPIVGLLLFFCYPLAAIGLRSLRDTDNSFSWANYARLGSDANIPRETLHSLLVSGTTMLLTMTAALIIAMALHRSRIRIKPGVRAALLLPMLAPSLMQGLGLIFLLGRNGLIHKFTGLNTDIYGFAGLVIADVCYTLPQAVIIISAALGRADRRYYDSADCMGASAWRQFIDITFPQARLGLLSAAFVVFTLTMTDFGNAIIVGGSYRVLASEIYDQVSGQMDFGMGAAVGILLLVPAIVSLLVERAAARRINASEHVLPFVPSPGPWRDGLLTGACIVLLAPVTLIFAVVVYASFVELWPYRLAITLVHYHTDLPDGYTPILTSLKASLLAASLGTSLTFMLAVGLRRLPYRASRVMNLISTLPAAVPGLIIGIGYVIAFDSGPMSKWLYGSLSIVVLCNFYHYHTQAFVTMSAGMRLVPATLEDAAGCLGAGNLRTVRDVVLPYTKGSLISVFFMLFMQSMVTVSAVIFLVTPDMGLASVSVMQLEQNGFISQAAAYATCIVLVVATALAIMRLLAMRVGRHLWQRGRLHVA